MVQLLQLIQLSDSAVPIGGAAHSFGLETLVEWNEVQGYTLEHFLQSFLSEQASLEACYCRAAYAAYAAGENIAPMGRLLSALKPATESREASIVLGRRLLGLCASIITPEQCKHLGMAFRHADSHHAIAFGYVSALLGCDEEQAVAAFLHQAIAAAVSTAQRLMPVGQKQAMAALWHLKTEIARVAKQSGTRDYRRAGNFMPLLEVASMRHPRLETRLFLS